MRGCMRLLAGLSAVLFVITAILALFVVNLAQALTDREAIKAALNEEELIREVAPSLMVATLQEQAAAQGLPVGEIDPAAWQTAVDLLLPPGWLNEQSDAAVDATFDYLESNEMTAPQLMVDVKPLVENLQGEAGRQAILTVLQSLPVCPGTEPFPEVGYGEVPFPTCLPPEVDVATTAGQIHSSLVTTIANNPMIAEMEGVIPLGQAIEAGAAESPESLEGLQNLRRGFALVQQWSGFLGLIPAAFLVLILVFGVRSLGGFGHWLGWPLALAGGMALLVVLVAPAVLTAFLRTAASSPEAGADGAIMTQLWPLFLDTLSRLWLHNVRWQAASMLVGGLFMIGVGFFGNWLEKGD
ncbi:MAG: hypothetical protein AB1791_07935 [Chloroflexota bacterium]